MAVSHMQKPSIKFTKYVIIMFNHFQIYIHNKID